MTGKIYPASDNVYQDQAKILFDYYQQAAEKIVREEERIEQEIASLESRRRELEGEVSKLWVWFLTIVLFFVYFIKKNDLMKQIADIDTRIAEFRKLHDEIFRDYKVTKLGVAYVPVANQVRYEDKSFIVDYTGTVPDSEIALQVSRQNDLLVETIGKLENHSAEAPIVEGSQEIETIATEDYSTSIQEINQHDYLGRLERSLRTIAFCMDDLETTSVSLPLVANDSAQLDFLKEFATKEVADDATVIDVFDRDRYEECIGMFRQLNSLKDSFSNETRQFEDVLKSLMIRMADSVQAVSTLKIASVDKVVLDSNKLLVNMLKAPYNHYSPLLEYEEIERIRHEKFDYSEDVQDYEPFKLRRSSRVKFDPLTGMWVSEDGNVTNMPFGVHQIHEEIVAPVVQNLMAETRIERLKIYNHIKDQKISYLNKWHQDTDAFYRANRAESSDIINLMQESLREYVAAYNTMISLERTMKAMKDSNGNLESAEVKAVDNVADTVAAFELESQKFQQTQIEFEEYMERLKDDIDLKAERFGHIEYYDAKLRDGYSNEMAVATSEIHQLDERRKSLAAVNPLFAKTSALPPEPNVEEITFEHISVNLPAMAKNVLEELDAVAAETPDAVEPVEEAVDEPVAPVAEEEAGTEPEVGEEVVPEAEESEAGESGAEPVEEDSEDDEEDSEDTEDDDEDGFISEESLAAMTDEELMAILDQWNIAYDKDNFRRDVAIEMIFEGSKE